MTDHETFLKMCTKKAKLYLAAYMNFHLYFPHSLSNLGEIQRSWLLTEPLQICEFHEDRQREGQTFLTSAIFHLHVYRVTQYTGVLICPQPDQEGNKLHSLHFMELGGDLPHSQQSTTCPYPSQINAFLCPSHFWQTQLVSFLVRLSTYQHPGTICSLVLQHIAKACYVTQPEE